MCFIREASRSVSVAQVQCAAPIPFAPVRMRCWLVRALLKTSSIVGFDGANEPAEERKKETGERTLAKEKKKLHRSELFSQHRFPGILVCGRKAT